MNNSSHASKGIIMREMMQFIKKNEIFSYAEFMDYAADNNLVWFRIATSDTGAFVIYEYIKSFAKKHNV